MVALNQHFTVLAIFCSLSTLSIPPTTNAAVIPADPTNLPSSLNAISVSTAKHGKTSHQRKQSESKIGKLHKARSLQWLPTTNALRLAGMYVQRSCEAQESSQAEDGSSISSQAPVIIPSSKGDGYVISPSRRDQGDPQGRMDIMSHVEGSADKRLACLFMEKTNDNYILNASEKNCTKIELHSVPSGNTRFSMLPNKDSEVPTTLQISLFDAAETGIVHYCATTNGKASSKEPQPLTVEKCFDEVEDDSDVQQKPFEKSEGSAGMKSQMFAYNTKTGAVRPLWFYGQDDGKTDDGTDPSTTKNIGAAGVTSILGARADSAEPSAGKNVTLMFVADDPKVADTEDGPPSSDALTATSTMTTTITVITTPTPSVSAAVADSTSSLGASPSINGPAMSSATTDSINPTASADALTVQVIGSLTASNTTSTDAAAPTTSVVAQDAETVLITSSPSATTRSDSAVPMTSVAAQDVGDVTTGAPASATLTSDFTAPTTSINAAGVSDSVAAPNAPSATPWLSASEDAASPTAAAAEDETTTDIAPSSTMTPVNTAPYQWMFKAENRL